MVVVLIIGILIAIALPVFLGARTRAQDKAAGSDLRNGVAAAKVLYSDTADYTSVTAAGMQGVEPSLTFVDETTASAAGNNFAVSFSVFNYGEVNMARLSASGTCFYIRTIDKQGPAGSDIPGTYYGKASGIACNGQTISGYGTNAIRFNGW